MVETWRAFRLGLAAGIIVGASGCIVSRRGTGFFEAPVGQARDESRADYRDVETPAGLAATIATGGDGGDSFQLAVVRTLDVVRYRRQVVRRSREIEQYSPLNDVLYESLFAPVVMMFFWAGFLDLGNSEGSGVDFFLLSPLWMLPGFQSSSLSVTKTATDIYGTHPTGRFAPVSDWVVVGSEEESYRSSRQEPVRSFVLSWPEGRLSCEVPSGGDALELVPREFAQAGYRGGPITVEASGLATELTPPMEFVARVLADQ